MGSDRAGTWVIGPSALVCRRLPLPGRSYSDFPQRTVDTTRRYCSYTNGKSIGNLAADALRAHGPHHFRCSKGAGGATSKVTHMIPPPVAVVLHYESGTYAKWRTK